MIRNKTKTATPVQKECYFCVNGRTEVDFKETQMLQRFTSSYGKILPRKKTGVCSKHQRKLAQAIKRARIMALMPFTTR